MRLKRIRLLFLLVVTVLLAVFLWPKPCEQYGGRSAFGSQSWNCQCVGAKVTLQNDALTDGYTIRKCIGLATHHACSQWDGIQRQGEVLSVPCSQK